MIRETRELLAALSKLNREVPNVMLGIVDGSLPVEKQIEFGELLKLAGEAMQEHGRTERVQVIESKKPGEE